MKNPPRTTKIRGQKHLLAYITPDEAKLLKAMGGSGEKVHGIPAYADVGHGGGWGGTGGENDGDPGGDAGMSGPGDMGGQDSGFDSGYSSGYADTGYGYGTHDDASSQSQTGLGMSPGESQARYGTPAFAGRTTAPSQGEIDAARADYQSSGRGFDVNLAKAMTTIAMAPPDQRENWVDRAIRNAYQTGKAPGLMGLLGFDLGRTQNFTRTTNPSLGIFESFQSQAPSFGMTGFFSDVFGLDPYVTTGFGESGMGDGSDMGGDGPDIVPAEYNPVTGEQDQCPDGYVFDEDLQACRMSADLPFGTPITTPGPYEAGDYARMGLLDIAPMGMSLFADRYGIPQMDFDTANLAFRRAGATRPQYFRKAPDLTGYTLLS